MATMWQWLRCHVLGSHRWQYVRPINAKHGDGHYRCTSCSATTEA